MTTINHRIFRAYDIRGKASIDLTADICRKVGQAFGTVLRERYTIDHPMVAVGWDARTHSPAFAGAVIAGLSQAGCQGLSIGQTPSPLNYFTVCARKLDGSIQITASHNPKEDNGIKLQLRNAEAYSGDDLQDLLHRIEESHFLTGEGSIETIDATTPYLEHLSRLFPNVAQGLSIVVDTGNGVAGPAYSEALQRAGANITGLYLEPDGMFPNHPADPNQLETLNDLRHTVKEQKADIGIAFDGDGDRLGIVDEEGTIRTPDEIILLLARDALQRHPGSTVVFTVSNSGILETEIARWGGKTVMCPVGHSFVEHAMREHGAILGGEQSGHFFCFEDYFGFDDALVAALRVLKILKLSDKTLSNLLSEFPRVYQLPELRPHCNDDQKTNVITRITRHFGKDHPVNTLDGVRIDFGEGAWAGIRQSNTSPRISICMEARSKRKLEAVKKTVLDHLRTYPEIRW